MGLRINTNTGALTALRNLQQNSVREVRTFERLSTGLRINRGSDDPSGLVILQQLSGQLAAISQAVENTQGAANLVNTADAALSGVSDLLVSLRSNVIAGLNTGVTGPESQFALQNSIDQALSAIDRIGATSRFGDIGLLNGNLGFNISNASPELTNIDVQGGSFQGGFPAQFQVDVTAAATRGQATGTIAAFQAGASTVNIQGPLGTEQLQFAAGTSQADVIAAINAVTENTGVEATAAGEIRTVDFGSGASVRVEEVTGDLSGIAPGIFNGTDIVAQVNGVQATGRANTIETTGNQIQAVITVQPETTGTFAFTIEGGGATFQVGPTSGGLNDVTIGIGATNSSTLGEGSGLGNLASLLSGGANSLQNNPAGAISVLDQAAQDVSALRARLGAVSTQVFQTNADELNVAFENLSAARSRLGDADLAEEIAAAVRSQLVREAGISVLRRANLNAGLALRLLG